MPPVVPDPRTIRAFETSEAFSDWLSTHHDVETELYLRIYKKGSGTPNTNKVGKLTKAQLKKIAEEKLKDLNTTSVEAAMRTIAGTARSMGVNVEGL